MNKIKTLGELAKENPDKTYKELVKIKEGVCVTAALKKDLEGPTFDEERRKFKKEINYHRYWKDMYEKEHKLRQEAQQKIKELEEILKSKDYTKETDYKFLVDENKKLHKEVDDLRHDNKTLTRQIDDQVNRARKAGM